MSGTNRSGQVGPPRFAVAVHALVWLAQSERVQSSASIACQVNSHATFLRRVMNPLAQAGLVEAREGRDGGYCLKLPPERITLADVYSAVKLEPAEAAEPPECDGKAEGLKLHLALNDIMNEVEQMTIETLKKHTIADMAAHAD